MRPLNNLNMILAHTEDGGIGYKNTIPWKCSSDMSFFKNITTDKSVIMGYNTFASLGFKALPNRCNFLFSERKIKDQVSVPVLDLDEMLEVVSENSDREYFVIGGTNTYEKFMPYVSKAYISTIDNSCVKEGQHIDTYMPVMPLDFNLQGVPHGDSSCVIRCYVR